MKLLQVAAIFLFTSLSFSAYGFDFKGVVLGGEATPEYIKEKLGVDCGEGAYGTQVCNGDVTIALEAATMNLVISKTGHVQRIVLSLSPDSFDIVSLELSKKFGRPKISTSVVQNRMGAKYKQIELTWSSKLGGSVIYSKYPVSLERSYLSFRTKEDEKFLAVDPVRRHRDL
jgi:hypothetical protein